MKALVGFPSTSNQLKFWPFVMIWAKNFFEKTRQNSEITAQSFEKTALEKGLSMDRFQKFLCMVDGHEKTDFSIK